MRYEIFTELQPLFPSGRYRVNSFQLRNLLAHSGCRSVSIRVLHLGTMALERDELMRRLASSEHPRLDDIRITCMDGELIIDEPAQSRL